MFDQFEDGYTFDFEYKAILGLRGGCKGKFRPVNYLDRETIHAKLSTMKGKDAAEVIARVVASQIAEWSFVDREGKKVEIKWENVARRLHSSHVDMLFNIVIGAIPSMAPEDYKQEPLADQDYMARLMNENPSTDTLTKN